MDGASATGVSSFDGVKPELVVDLTHLAWMEDNLLRQVCYQGQREHGSAIKLSCICPTSVHTAMCNRSLQAHLGSNSNVDGESRVAEPPLAA